METTYRQDENGMLIPDFQPPERILPTGKYGTMRKQYLYQHRRHRYDEMLLDGTLNQHLQQTDSRATEMLVDLTQRLEQENPPSEALNVQQRTAHFRGIHLAAEQTVMDEIIFRP